MRINKYLSASGVCSRREADKWIEAGRVTVNGKPAVIGTDVKQTDLVEADGRRVEPAADEIYLAVNKPRGYVVTTDRTYDDLLLEDLIDLPDRVFAAGRLDKDSEGLILMTNNGDVSNLIQKAREQHEKEYIVTVDREIRDQDLREMRKGVYLADLDRTTRPCRIDRLGSRTFRIILTEGMNRQIRRMCAAFGYEVEQLKRVRIMNILLGELQPGAYRKLTEREIAEMKLQLNPEKQRRQILPQSMEKYTLKNRNL